jgi:PAS domain S-box-containing protein
VNSEPVQISEQHRCAGRDLAQRLQELSVTILRILSDDEPISVTLERVVETIRSVLQLDAVGVRLRSGDDFPYASHVGFTADFVQHENRLRPASADECSWSDQAPYECLCGMVISGKVEEASPAFTQDGSFWLNVEPSFSRVRRLPIHLTRHLRNRCFIEGFKSIALIPIRSHQQIIGLLQLNARQSGRLDRDLVSYFEGLSAGIGLAIMRKQAEAALSAKNTQFELALDASNMGVWRWDIPSDVREFDATTCELLGIDPSTFGGRGHEFFDRILPEDRERVRVELRKTTETGSRYEVEYRVAGPEGKPRYLTARGRCVFDNAGRPRSIHGILWDVTDKKRTQEALSKSEEKYRLLFAMMTEGVALHEIVRDASGDVVDYRYVDVNPAFERITRIRAGDVVGKTIRQLQPQVSQSRIALRSRVALTGEPETFEGYDELLGRYCRVAVFSPQLGQFATVFEDITERKLAEQALQENHDELERFTRAVSHDLRSPLVTVQTFVEYLAQDLAATDLPAAAKDMEFIRKATDQMSRLLRELLELSRIGRIHREPTEVPLQSVVNEALSLVAGRLSTRPFQITVTQLPILLHGDVSRFVELFQNLLENAAKFMGAQPEPRIEIGAECTNAALVLFVRDNGSGFPQQACQRIFDLFQRLHGDTEGMGVGLSLVRRIVQVHGGRVWAESEGPNQGACFKFTLARTRILQTEIGVAAQP